MNDKSNPTGGATRSFEGFTVPEQNWFKLPNNWTDITASMNSWAEHKVVEYVLRHTWGFQEYGQLKLITLDEFENGRKRRDGSRMDNGVGLRRQAIISGLKLAVEDGFLIVDTDDRDKGRVKKYYGLKMMVNSPSQGYEDHTPAENQRGDGHTPEVRSPDSQSPEITPRTEKDTFRKTLLKENGQYPEEEPSFESSVWPGVLEVCRRQMTQATFDTCLARTKLLSLTDSTAVIGVPDALSQEWLENRLREMLQRTAASYLDRPALQLEFELLP